VGSMRSDRPTQRLCWTVPGSEGAYELGPAPSTRVLLCHDPDEKADAGERLFGRETWWRVSGLAFRGVKRRAQFAKEPLLLFCQDRP
jgi:hypothetical protein